MSYVIPWVYFRISVFIWLFQKSSRNLSVCQKSLKSHVFLVFSHHGYSRIFRDVTNNILKSLGLKATEPFFARLLKYIYIYIYVNKELLTNFGSWSKKILKFLKFILLLLLDY